MRVEAISSSSNAKFKSWLNLLSARGIREQNLCLVSGEKIIHEILEKHQDLVSCVLATTDFAEQLVVSHQSKTQQSPYHKSPLLFALKRELFRELDSFGTHSPLLVVKTPVLQKLSFSNTSGLELVIPFSDPGNVGAVIRSAMAFNVSKIILTEEAASPYLPKSIRASVGLTLFAPLYRGPKLSEFSKLTTNTAEQNQNKIQTYILDMNGQNIGKFHWPQNVRLIIGEEGLGVPSSLNNLPRISIPMNSKVESLNAAIATSLVLFDYARQV